LISDLKADYESFKTEKTEQVKILEEKLEKTREDLNESRYVICAKHNIYFDLFKSRNITFKTLYKVWLINFIIILYLAFG